MKSQITDDFTKSVIQLGGLLMQFSHVKRVTYTDKKGTRETDTDHTTMLAIMACAIASELEPKLDLGKVAQYALVHDLEEVYAGDVNTINFHTIDHKAKQINEARALARIKEEYGKIFPWIHTTIEQYEQLTDREARFVKTLDKLMPALTHVHTDNQVINENFNDPVEYEKSVNARNKHMRETFAHDQTAIMELRERIVADIVKMKYEYHVRKTTGTKGEKS
jgi:putative hydrolase of HD superfamily